MKKLIKFINKWKSDFTKGAHDYGNARITICESLTDAGKVCEKQEQNNMNDYTLTHASQH